MENTQDARTRSIDAAASARVARWTQKLLDLSARNRLLNVPEKSRSLLRLAPLDIAKLEDSLAARESMSVPESAEEISEKDLARRLLELMRASRRDLEETGSNTLFVTLGELVWIDESQGAQAKARRAPILLVPVRLERPSIAEGFRMRILDEETMLNATLVELLRAQFSITVEGMDPLPADDSGVDVPRVMEAFRKAVAPKEGWSVTDSATIGLYSFGKFVLWKDLTVREYELRRNQLVNHIASGGGRFDDGVRVFPADEIAENITPGELFCPVAYDSSQLTAVLWSGLGKSFVLHGPPGTGKSQTITNIIAHNLARGRRVLFVSEKKAALDVVKSRLDRVGLTPFCMELHSTKVEKAHVYDQIRDALEVKESAMPRSWKSLIAEFDSVEYGLEGYVAELHKRYPNGMSAYDAFAHAIAKRVAAKPAMSQLVDADVLKQSETEKSAMREALVDFAAELSGVSADALAATPELASTDWTPALARDLLAAAGRFAAAADASAAPDDAFEREKALAAELAESEKAFFIARFFRRRSVARRTDALRARMGAELLASRDRLAEFVPPEFFSGGLKSSASKCRAFASVAGELRAVMRARKARDKARAAGAGKMAEWLAADADASVLADVGAFFDDAYAARMLDEVLAGTPALANFAGLSHEKRIERFRELDAKSKELAKTAVFSKLAARVVTLNGGAGPAAKELAVLKRECEKKRRQKPVRTLLAECRELLPTLKPCFLMSPLSVAQYLPVDGDKFDLVVFDEASQIPVWDAIGVIARGKQLVVVGDPKQMPPTSFFQKGETETDEVMDDDDVEIEDQESILDECLVAGVPSAYLSWHYRSRHESLIAFSNEHYYDGKLSTFPAAGDSPRLGVKFVHVAEGRFDKSGKGPKVNAKEAEALVDYLAAEVRKPDWKGRSVGIVAFSITQRKLIADILEERRAADAELERLLPDADADDGCFVKNLENVQGDERDVILFSVGYAPDSSGRFSMNFGPLNLAGGERRLNVAVTRAKEQVVVFSSIRAADIDAGEGGRAKSVGAGHLKAFLDYAERASSGKAASPSGAGKSSEVFADVVAEFLESKGYAVDRNVGRSGLRIDIAVRDPENPSRHILGIECDGPSYARQKTAQDRDVNRIGVLAGLGWKMVRVWSVDWALDRARAESALLTRLPPQGRADALEVGGTIWYNAGK